MNYTQPHLPAQWKEPRKPEMQLISPPERPSLSSVFPNLDRWSIGFDPMFGVLKTLSETKTSSYPPYNITRDGETYVLELAVSGFKKKEISIEVADQTLTVQSKKLATAKPSGEVLHNGIAKREWRLNFALAETVEVESATMEDGILTIVMQNIIPEHLKAKTIEIK